MKCNLSNLYCSYPECTCDKKQKKGLVRGESYLVKKDDVECYCTFEYYSKKLAIYFFDNSGEEIWFRSQDLNKFVNFES